MRVRTEVRLAPASIRNMGVELRRAEVGVAEHLLDAAEVGAALQQVRGERVAEEVRVDPLGVEPGLRRQAPEDEERAGPCERSALGVEEELGPVAAVEVRPPAAEVAAQRLDRLAAERDDALLVPLPHATDRATLEVDAAPLEADRLADAQARAVQELDERAVAQAPRRRAVRRVDQALDLAEGEGAGEAAPAARQVDLRRGVVGPLAEGDEVTVEAARRRGTPRDRAGRLAAGAEVGEPRLDVGRARGRRRSAEMPGEVGQVAAVGLDRARRPAGREEREEALDGRIGLYGTCHGVRPGPGRRWTGPGED
jgi:hypothetical protein